MAAHRSLVHAALGTALVAGSVSLAVPALGAGATGSTHVLSDVLPHLSSFTDRGAVGARLPMRIGVQLRNPKQAAKDAAEQAMYTPGSATYHRFLSPSSFNAKFGISPSVTKSVASALSRHGLHVSYTSGDGSYLVLAGPAAAVERTFGVHLHSFARTHGSRFFANVDEPTVPAAVETVIGLSDFATMQPMSNQWGPDHDPASTTDQENRFCGLPVPNACYGVLIPQDLWGVYHAPKSDLGMGEKIGIYGSESPTAVFSDLRHYEADHGLPQVPVREILTNADLTGTATPTEADLDVAAAQGMAPDLAELDLYFDSGLAADMGTTFQKWAGDAAGPQIMNISYGLCEPVMLALGWQAAMEAPLQQAVMEGRTAFASTGDTGGSCAAGNGIVNDGVPAANYPSSSAFVVAVGGTVVMTKNTGTASATELWPATRSTEIAWTHGGGGHSIMEPEPKYQQAVAPVTTNCVLTHDGSDVDSNLSPCRNVPDVAAMSGDLWNGYAIYSGGAESESGGTSLSSPLWAGFWARVVAAHDNSTCAAVGSKVAGPIGFANPTFYALAVRSGADAASFTDITTGSNGEQVALPRNKSVDPSGYDNVTGLGVPNVAGLLKWIDCGRTTPVATSNPVEQTDAPIIDPLSTGS